MAVFGRVRKQTKVGEGSETSLVRSRALSPLRSALNKTAMLRRLQTTKKNYSVFIVYSFPRP